MKVTRVLDKTSSFGALVAAMSCAGCFPALGSLGAALGLGFLSQYEGFMFRKLIPGLAVLALLVNAWGWYRHRRNLPRQADISKVERLAGWLRYSMGVMPLSASCSRCSL